MQNLCQKHMLTTEIIASDLEAVSGMLTPAQDETTEGVQALSVYLINLCPTSIEFNKTT